MDTETRTSTRVAPSGLQISTGSVFLRPVATPFALGLSSLASAFIMYGAFTAKWFGSSTTPLLLAPFVAFLGLTQLIAATWAYRSRDGLATALLGIWGSFWLGYGLLQLLVADKVLAAPTATSPEFGFWLIAVAAITLSAAWASLSRNWALASTLIALTVTAIIGAISQFTGNSVLSVITGYGFIVSAVLAWYTATASMLKSSFGRQVIPTGRILSDEQIAGIDRIEREPGIRRGE